MSARPLRHVDDRPLLTTDLARADARRRADATLLRYAAPARPDPDAALDARLAAAKALPARRRERDADLEQHAQRLDMKIQLELDDTEREMRESLLAQGASPAWCEENIDAIIPVLRATKEAERDRTLAALRRAR